MKLKEVKLGKKQIIGLAIGGVVVIGIVIGAIKGSTIATAGKASKNGVPVQAHTVSTDSISAQISSAGEVEANNKESIYSEVSGTIEEVMVEVGDQIKVGDIILRFDQDTKTRLGRDLEKLKLQLASAKTSLNDLTSQGGKQEILQAESSLIQVEKSEKDILDSIETQELSIEQVKRELETAIKMEKDQKELLEAGIIAQKEYDDAADMVKGIQDKLKAATIQLEGTKLSIKSIDAQKQNAKYALDVVKNNVTDKSKKQAIELKQNEIKSIDLQIEALEDELSKANIEVLSTVAGTVSEVMVEKGATVGVGTPLVTILDLSILKVKSDISTFNGPQIQLGQKAIIKQDSLEAKEYTGIVTEIAPAAIKKQSGTSTSNVLPIIIEIQETQTELKPGYNVDVKIKTVEKDVAITLPILAIMEDDDADYKYVFVIKDDNTLEKRQVQELTIDNISIEVSGVEIGERVVADPTESLEEGTLVLLPETGENE
ncbi:MAG TPA: HlyD family efflux transporter periplasmic adaptor subunit [Epulopiscium sp.]|nr:HlyD family efflux transporter periplasmic adaptor subunit [Candidatus Epulonipiscium sp.]